MAILPCLKIRRPCRDLAQKPFIIFMRRTRKITIMYLAKDLPDEFYEHLLAHRQDNSKKFGDEYENWTHQGRKHDYFDCLKMFYALVEFCKLNYPKEIW